MSAAAANSSKTPANRAIDWLRQAIPTGTDQRVKATLLSCLDEITSRHSVTSRRYALAAILRVQLDYEVRRVIEGYPGTWDRELLSGFTLSEVWKRSPPRGGERTRTQDNLPRVDAALRYAESWRSRVRSAIHSAERPPIDDHVAEWLRFCATLDAVIYCIDVFGTLLPGRTNVAKGARQPRQKAWGADYCELCWRKVEFLVASEASESGQIVRGSRRFCREHNPRTKNSVYWRDRRYKDAFDAEIHRLHQRRRWSTNDLGTALLELEPDPSRVAGARMHVAPLTVHEEDLRRAAYAMVRAGLQGTREACMIMRSRGATNKEIAASLNISERAVRLAFETARKRILHAAEVRWNKQ